MFNFLYFVIKYPHSCFISADRNYNTPISIIPIRGSRSTNYLINWLHEFTKQFPLETLFGIFFKIIG